MTLSWWNRHPRPNLHQVLFEVNSGSDRYSLLFGKAEGFGVQGSDGKQQDNGECATVRGRPSAPHEVLCLL